MTDAASLPCLLVTRPVAQALPWVEDLRALGCRAEALPLIDIAPVESPHEVQQAWRRLPGAALAMFVSANAVEQFFAARPAGLGWPPGVWAGATGPGTRAALERAGVPAADIVQPDEAAGRWDSEALWQALRQRRSDWRDASALIVRGEDGRDWLAEALRAEGAEVAFVTAYRRRAPALSPAQSRLLAEAVATPAAYLWLFSSSEAVAHLGRLAPAADWSAARAVASHPRIGAAAVSLGFGAVRVLAWSNPSQLLRALVAA